VIDGGLCHCSSVPVTNFPADVSFFFFFKKLKFSRSSLIKVRAKCQGFLMCFSAGYFEFLELKVVYVIIKIKRYKTEAECIYDYLVISLK